MQGQKVDLAGIFQSVTQALVENQQSLNQADEINRDHGDNMVQTFQTISSALEQKKGGSDSAALAYAAKKLSKSATSGSGQLYAQNLTQAANQFKGKQIDAQGAVQLLQMLIGGARAPQPVPQQPAGQDMLGALLGGLTGGAPSAQPMGQQAGQGGDLFGELLGGLTGQAPQAQYQPQTQAQPPQQAGGDLLGALLGGLTGGTAAPSGGAASSGASSGGLSDGLGMDDLLNAGMAYFQARQSGGSNTQAIFQALLAGSGMGNTTHRNQSTQVVINTFLQALGSLGGRQ